MSHTLPSAKRSLWGEETSKAGMVPFARGPPPAVLPPLGKETRNGCVAAAMELPDDTSCSTPGSPEDHDAVVVRARVLRSISSTDTAAIPAFGLAAGRFPTFGRALGPECNARTSATCAVAALAPTLACATSTVSSRAMPLTTSSSSTSASLATASAASANAMARMNGLAPALRGDRNGVASKERGTGPQRAPGSPSHA